MTKLRPKGWVLVELGEALNSANSGVSVGGEHRPRATGEHAVLRTSCVATGIFRPDAYKVVTGADRARLAEPLLSDSIIVSRANTPELVGANAYVARGDAALFLSDKLWQLRTNSRAVPRFLSYCLSSETMRKRSRALATGTSASMRNISKESFLALPVLLPPLNEQRRIADALAVWDRAIETVEALVAEKRRRRLGYLQRRVFGAQFAEADTGGLSLTQKRLSGSNRWPMRKIGDFSTEVSRLNRAGEDLPVLSCTKHAGVVLSAEYFSGRRVHAEDTSGYKIVRRGEFVYATNHLEEGSIGLQHLTDAGVVSPMYTVFSVDDALVNRDFLFAVLKTETYRQVFQINTAASVDRRGGLRWDEFAALPFALPSLVEQQSIASALRALDTDLSADASLLDTLRAQKRGLMQKLLTGEWRLSSDTSEQAA